MNTNQAQAALLRKVGLSVTASYVVSPYWIIPKDWFDWQTLADALAKSGPASSPECVENAVHRYLTLGQNHAELAWPEVDLCVLGNERCRTEYLYLVRETHGLVRTVWFDAIAILAPVDVYMWAVSASQPIVFADADEEPLAVLMPVYTRGVMDAQLAEFFGGVS